MIPRNIRILSHVETNVILRCDDNNYLHIINTSVIDRINHEKVNKTILKAFEHYILIGEMHRNLKHLEAPMNGLCMLIQNYVTLKVPQTHIDDLINVYYTVKNDIEAIETKYDIKTTFVIAPFVQKKRTKSNKFPGFQGISKFFVLIKNKIKLFWMRIRPKFR